MSDVETNTEWSQILGKAMAGPLKGTQLERIPSDMITWASWKKQYPKTQVLNMSRTHRAYNSAFYKNLNRFVLGMVVHGQAYHASYKDMQVKQIQNVAMAKELFVVTFTASNTSARVFSRIIDGKTLSFKVAEAATTKNRDDRADDASTLMMDIETSSVWNRSTGLAVSGKLKGKQLVHEVGIPSFTKAWSTFHPKSQGLN
jgi:hypothetical protein